MPETPNNFTPGPQQEPDDMQVTNLDGSPLGPRTYPRRFVVLTALTTFATGVTAAAVVPRIAAQLIHPDGSKHPQPYENPYPLHPSEIKEGSITTELTCISGGHGLALRTSPDSSAPLVDYQTIDTIGAYDPRQKTFVGLLWPGLSERQPADTVVITVTNLIVQQVGNKPWGVLQTLSMPQVSKYSKINGKTTIQNVYFDLSGPSASQNLTQSHVTYTDNTNLAYHIEYTDGTTADIPMGDVDLVANISKAA